MLIKIDEITLRDYFAAKAMQGIVSSGNDIVINGVKFNLENAAYIIADSMIQERNKKC